MHTIYGIQYLHVSLYRPRRHANEAPAHLHTIAFHQQAQGRQAAAVFHRGIRQQRRMAVDKAVAAHANWKGKCRNQAGRKK